MGRTGTTRRHALTVAGAAAVAMLTGCSSGEPEKRRTTGSGHDSARAETALRRRLAGASAALRDRYDAVIARHPSLSGRLTPLRTAVAEHAKALAGPAAVSPSGTPMAVAAEPRAALKELAAAERSTASTHTTALLDAEPELARLLASVAAAGATHVYLLTDRPVKEGS